MAENKTKPTRISPQAFLKKVASPGQRKDCAELVSMMRKITGDPPRMWGPSIVGFGTCHYAYESGREGEICLTGFSPRKPNLVLYLGEVVQDKTLIAKLGKCKANKGCLYIKKLDDVNRTALRSLIAKSVRETRKRYPA